MIERQIDEDTFSQRFPLRTNHLVDDAPFDGCMFETYGEELAFVRQQDMRCVWTVLDCDGDLSIASGFHFVNRIGYLISLHPVAHGNAYAVNLECDVDTTV
jgi:hypothetical protein